MDDSLPSLDDAHYMQLALQAASEAEAQGEVPVGAVVVLNGSVVGLGWNEREASHDPTAHAELLAIRRAAQALGHWRLCDAEVFVTLEPCPMCAGAMINARIKRVIYGCDDPKAGAVRSLYQLLQDQRFNHRVDVTAGVLADECAARLKAFFAALRLKRAAVSGP